MLPKSNVESKVQTNDLQEYVNKKRKSSKDDETGCRKG